ncbi:MAG: PorT family protein [Bacteroidetes bacterium]|nr:PorT family protein [Bacteroidota bacterium]MBU2466321.1 PorT family protein [Bacteroidota bacterium]MBU2558324.1 PorT family protein [Bacteroidota bacterium]
MKKIIFAALFMMIASALSAQISLGPKIGYTTNKLSTDKSDITSDLKNSFIYGAFLRLGDKWYIQPEINFYTAGGVFKTPDIASPNPVNDEVELKTIQIPLYIGLTLADLKLAKIRAQAGPTANIYTEKKINPLSGSTYASIKETDINDIQWGFQFGAGVDVLMFTLDVQYYLGLNNVISDIEVGGEKVTFDSKSKGFMVTLGWKII